MNLSTKNQHKLEVFYKILLEWQKSLNLVSSTTLSQGWENGWRRHVEDSLQLLGRIPQGACVGDMGSGAGFPGLVLALEGDFHVHLVEADERKGIFLREVIRQTQAKATVHTCRIENFQEVGVDTWVSRAFAPLEKTLYLAKNFWRSEVQYLTLKGGTWAEEIDQARRSWQFDVEVYQSLTHPEARVLSLRNICRS